MKYLITGGSGFLGQALIAKMSETLYSCIRVVSRNEGELIKLKQKFPSIEILTGDIADQSICEEALQDVCGVFHLAAFKHVGWAESQPKECISTNILGTLNLLSASSLQEMDFIIGISTDKAAQIKGVYGATKFLMEKLFTQFESFNPQTKYRIVRFGNVMYSTGSVLGKWKELLQKHETVTITDLYATRFYWTVEQSVDLIFECLEKATSSSPYIPKMKAIMLGDLLECMISKYGDGVYRVEKIGLQPGENKHETMDGKTFSNQCERYTNEEIMAMI